LRPNVAVKQQKRRRAGRLHHIGVGRTNYRTRVLILIQDLNVRIINAATGDLMRELTINTTATTNPAESDPAPQRNNPNPNRGFG